MVAVLPSRISPIHCPSKSLRIAYTRPNGIRRIISSIYAIQTIKLDYDNRPKIFAISTASLTYNPGEFRIMRLASVAELTLTPATDTN